jgi:hypothetical protein
MTVEEGMPAEYYLDIMSKYQYDNPNYMTAVIHLKRWADAQKLAEDARQQRLIAQTEQHHAQRQLWTKIAAGIAVGGALAAWAAFTYARFDTADVRREMIPIRERLATLERIRGDREPSKPPQAPPSQVTLTPPQAKSPDSVIPNPLDQTTPEPKKKE